MRVGCSTQKTLHRGGTALWVFCGRIHSQLHRYKCSCSEQITSRKIRPLSCTEKGVHLFCNIIKRERPCVVKLPNTKKGVKMHCPAGYFWLNWRCLKNQWNIVTLTWPRQRFLISTSQIRKLTLLGFWCVNNAYRMMNMYWNCPPPPFLTILNLINASVHK